MGLLEFFTGNQPPLIKGALGDFCVMLDTGRDMFAAASACLLDNEILEVELAALSEQINRREEALRRAVLEHLNVDPKSELVLGLKLLTVAQDAQPVGQISVSMAKIAERAGRPRMGPLSDRLRGLRNRLLPLFDLTRDCFLKGDPQIAQHILSEQAEVSVSLAQFLDREISGEAEDGLVAIYAIAAHTMQCVSVHLANIASTVSMPFHQIRAYAR